LETREDILQLNYFIGEMIRVV